MKMNWLVVELGKSPATRLFRCERGVLYRGYFPRTSYPGSIGHYDWLRSGASKVVGVRFWPFSDAVHAAAIESLMNICSLLPYAEVDPQGRSVSIFFGERKMAFLEECSSDQDTGECGIYENKDGGMMLCFEIDPRVSLGLPPDWVITELNA